MRALALVPFVLASPALALTPEELWATWQGQAAAWGVTLEAEAAAGADGALGLSGFRVARGGGPAEPLPPGAAVQAVTLTPTGDGGVAIDLGLPANGRLPDFEGGELWIASRGLSLVARDDGPGLVYDLAAASLALVASNPAEGELVSQVAWELSDLAVRADGGMREGAIGLSASWDGLAALTESQSLLGGLSARDWSRTEGRVAVEATLRLPEGAWPGSAAEVVALLQSGAAFEMTMRSEGGSAETSSENAILTYATEGTFAPGEAEVRVGDGRALMRAGSTGASELSISAPALPGGPVGVRFGDAAIELLVPFGPGMGDARWMVGLGGVALDEAGWALIDPEGRLPHDPMMLGLALDARMRMDLAAIVAAQEAGTEPPVPEVEVVAGEGHLSAAGVTATAVGDVSLGLVDGLVQPVGGLVTAEVAGLDRLLGALVALGWVAEADLAGLRMGLALAFKPTGAPDTLGSSVEFGPGGAVTVNGVRMR